MTNPDTPAPRPNTPDVNLPDGGVRITTKRACNECGTIVGDASTADMAAAVAGLTLPDVRDECPTCTPAPAATPNRVYVPLTGDWWEPHPLFPDVYRMVEPCTDTCHALVHGLHPERFRHAEDADVVLALAGPHPDATPAAPDASTPGTYTDAGYAAQWTLAAHALADAARELTTAGFTMERYALNPPGRPAAREEHQRHATALRAAMTDVAQHIVAVTNHDPSNTQRLAAATDRLAAAVRAARHALP